MAEETFDRWLRATGLADAPPALSAWLRTTQGPPAEGATPPLPPRYEARGRLGAGGMGEVLRVHDLLLGRDVALKALHPGLATHTRFLERFHTETRLAAGLGHPATVPVHDLGTLPDGRPYFTMRIVEGRGYGDAIRAVHTASAAGEWRAAPDGWTLSRLIEALTTAADALAYAHARGLTHRDFKPDNLMLGPHGEALVVDWGLARLETATDDRSVHGTPAYMAPEQANGEPVGPAVDAWGLGATLYEVLRNRPPFQGATTDEALRAVRAGRPGPLTDGPLPLPPELVELVTTTLARDPSARPTAAAIATALRRWRDGEGRRARAREHVEVSRARAATLTEAQEEARRLRVAADALLARAPLWADTVAKASAWAAEDRALTAERDIRRGDGEVEDLLTAALALDPDQADAHGDLAERARLRHAAAEAERDLDGAERIERQLSRHVAALPATWARRPALQRYLRGLGALTLLPEPRSARHTLRPYVPFERRLVPGEVLAEGEGPLTACDLPAGRYLVTLTAPGHADVRYPVWIRRDHHWDGVPPGGTTPLPIRMPRVGELDADDVYVPAGWCTVGGDPLAPGSLPGMSVWVDAFVIRRFPVTNAEWIRFLDGLVAEGRADLADHCVPRERGARPGVPGGRIYGREGDHHRLVPDADGDVWSPDWPVIMVDHVAAWTYARWEGKQREGRRTGTPWRLPGELEWEKAARGADGRWMPWGDYGDPSWYSGSRSFPGRATIEPVTARPIDESPYGVRCMAGHVVEWTADRMHPQGPERPGGHVVVPDGSADGIEAWAERTATHRIVGRGGSRVTDLKFARAAFRTAIEPWSVASNIGVRIARSFASETS